MSTERYIFPTLDLLSSTMLIDERENDRTEKLQSILNDLKIKATIECHTTGSRVTQYETRLDVNVLLSKVERLTRDIALRLGVEQVRICPAPGKEGLIGIEIPNKHIQPVSIRKIIASTAFKNTESKITFGLGETVEGNIIIDDIAEMPHLLVAGATGTGKSVFLNTLITSILYKSTPEEVRFLMIDPKMVELASYDGLPHLLSPIITDTKKAIRALEWAVGEMDRRYSLMAALGVKNYNEYNVKSNEKLPQIVIIIDELADLIMTCTNRENDMTLIEKLIARLVQKSRAGGIHLVVATQRPDAKTITPSIKANLPSKIAFRVATGSNSKVIIDEMGAEKLLGKGDMLFQSSTSMPLRLQGAFISNDEIENIVKYIVRNNNEAVYNTELMELLDDTSSVPYWIKDPYNQTDRAEIEHQLGYTISDELFKEIVNKIFYKAYGVFL